MLVDQIIAAKKAYDESDRPWLSKLADGQLKKIASSCGCTAAPDPAAAASPDPTPPAVVTPDPAPDASAAPPAPAAAPVAAAAPAVVEPEKVLTAEEWIAQAPENIRPLFGNLLAGRRASEAQLREKIVSQTGGALTKEYLENKPLEELETLAVATLKPDFSGRGIQSGDPIAQAGKPAEAPRMPGIKVGTRAAA